MLPFLINKFFFLLISFVVVIEHGDGNKEKELTVEIAFKLKENLIKNRICDIVLTESKDIPISQIEKASIVNQLNGDIFLSLHLNSCISNQASGFEVFHSTKIDTNNKLPVQFELVQNKYYKNSKALANIISMSFDKEFNEGTEVIWNTSNRGVTEADLLPLKGIAMPAVLIELGFLTNEVEANKIKDPLWLEKVSNAISKSILDYRDKYEK